jgi:SAM-dependent methyltransferase
MAPAQRTGEEGLRTVPEQEPNADSPCPACGSQGGSFLYHACDQTHAVPGRFPVCRCRACHSLYLYPAPSATELAAYYPADYYSYTPEAEDPSWIGRTIRRLLRPLPAPPPPHPGARALDLGCGAGDYLNGLQRLGWETWGVEPAAPAVAVARAAGHHVLQTELEQAALPEGHFHLISLSHVIEHLPDPRAALDQVAHAAAPGARVLLRTPAANSLTARLLGPDWLPLDAPRHLLIFSTSALRRAAEQAGLEVLRLWRRQDPRYLLSSLLRKWLSLREGVRPRQALLVRPRHIVLGFPGAWLVELLQQGDEMTLDCRRRPAERSATHGRRLSP